jgi:hypothetical protein
MSPRDAARFENLAQTIAFGRQSVRDWCQANSASERTAYKWSSSTEFKQRVAELRQAAFDGAIGKMTTMLDEAVEKLATLIKSGERKDIVKLQAARGLIADLVAMREIVSRDQEIADLRAEVENLKRSFRDEAPLKIAGS